MMNGNLATNEKIEEKIEDNENSLHSLLCALATINCDVAEQLEKTSSGIAQDLMKLGGWNKDVVVKLQDFDRMRQELSAVGGALRRCADLITVADAAHGVQTIVSEISLSKMQRRLLDALSTLVLDSVDRQTEPDHIEPEMVF
jgi:hypothetical protein